MLIQVFQESDTKMGLDAQDIFWEKTPMKVTGKEAVEDLPSMKERKRRRVG